MLRVFRHTAYPSSVYLIASVFYAHTIPIASVTTFAHIEKSFTDRQNSVAASSVCARLVIVNYLLQTRLVIIICFFFFFFKFSLSFCSVVHSFVVSCIVSFMFWFSENKKIKYDSTRSQLRVWHGHCVIIFFVHLFCSLAVPSLRPSVRQGN